MTNQKKVERKRAIANKGTEVPMQKYDLYKQAFGWINYAIESGFYLEAISLIESIITDRMESRLVYLKATDVEFKTIGHLIGKLKTYEQVEGIIQKLPLIKNWSEFRNKALHEMVKIEDGNYKPWSLKVSENKNTAMTGLKLLKQLDALLAKEKRRVAKAN